MIETAQLAIGFQRRCSLRRTKKGTVNFPVQGSEHMTDYIYLQAVEKPIFQI